MVIFFRMRELIISRMPYLLFHTCLYDLLNIGQRNPNGIKQKILSTNSKLIPLINGIKLILGLNNDSPKSNSLKNSLIVGIPTIFLKTIHR